MSILATLALQSGLPLIEKLLSKKIGDQGGALATAVISAIATRSGVLPEEVEALADTTPGKVIEAMREVERASPELLAAYDRDLQLQLATLAAELDVSLGLPLALEPCDPACGECGLENRAATLADHGSAGADRPVPLALHGWPHGAARSG